MSDPKPALTKVKTELKQIKKDVEKETASPPSEEETVILLENAKKQFFALKKEDKRYLGIDLDAREYWIRGHRFKIKQLGFNSKKELGKYFDRHDDLAKEYAELIEEKDAMKRVTLLADMDRIKDDVVEKTIPIMITDMKGGFDTKKWFGDEIPFGVWFDVATDLYLFLRGSGSKEDTLRSMIVSTSE